MPLSDATPTTYDEAINAMTAFAEADDAVAGFSDVGFLTEDGTERVLDFVVSRSFGTVIVRPERPTAPVACEECQGIGYVIRERPGCHEHYADCPDCAGTGMPPERDW